MRRQTDSYSRARSSRLRPETWDGEKRRLHRKRPQCSSSNRTKNVPHPHHPVASVPDARWLSGDLYCVRASDNFSVPTLTVSPSLANGLSQQQKQRPQPQEVGERMRALQSVHFCAGTSSESDARRAVAVAAASAATAPKAVKVGSQSLKDSLAFAQKTHGQTRRADSQSGGRARGQERSISQSQQQQQSQDVCRRRRRRRRRVYCWAESCAGWLSRRLSAAEVEAAVWGERARRRLPLPVSSRGHSESPANQQQQQCERRRVVLRGESRARKQRTRVTNNIQALVAHAQMTTQ